MYSSGKARFSYASVAISGAWAPANTSVVRSDGTIWAMPDDALLREQRTNLARQRWVSNGVAAIAG